MLSAELTRVGINAVVDSWIAANSSYLLATDPTSIDPSRILAMTQPFVPTITLNDISLVLSQPTTAQMAQNLVSQNTATTLAQVATNLNGLSQIAVTGGPIKAIAARGLRAGEPQMKEANACETGWLIGATMLGVLAFGIGVATENPVLIYLGAGELRFSDMVAIAGLLEGIAGVTC